MAAKKDTQPKPKTAPVRKPAKKAVKKAPAPKVTEAQHEAWFMSLKAEYYAQLQKEWVEKNIKIKLIKQKDYDGWLNYFKTLPARKLQILATTGMDILDAEAYSALLRWRDIMANPHRIDKIHQAGLTNANKEKGVKTITELAMANDRLGVLQATRDKIAQQLEKGAGARDTAALARELTEVMTQISDYEKRLGPKKETKLGQLLEGVDDVRRKRPAKNGGGARNTSFKSRVTIQDVET